MAPTGGRAPTELKQFKPRHTVAQRVMLVVSALVAIGCFAAATGLLIGKNLRESLSAAPHVTYAPDEPTRPTTATPATGIITGTGPASTGPTETFPTPDPKAENFLITGDDNHSCVDPTSPWAGAVTNRDSIGSRSDTIMVLRIDPTTKAAALLSFPSDLWVRIPGNGMQRINTASQHGQYQLLADTLDQNFGVRVDHFVQIDFCAFKTIVDHIGGVAVPLSTPIRDPNVGIDIENVSACHVFSGDEALAYVRSRHLQYLAPDDTWKPDNSADFGRISRQQDFLRRMLKAALNKGLFNPSVARGLLEAAQKYVVFDSGFSINDMLGFAGLMRDIDPSTIHSYQIQATGTFRGTAQVLLPQIDGANMKAILAIFRGQAALAGAPKQVTDTTVATTTTSTSSSATTTTVAATPGAGLVTTTELGATTSPGSTITIATQPAATTTPVTNPSDIVHGVLPNQTAVC
ncbi:MAG: LCP family protein [Ilumatobacteraceae bacterium]